MKVICKIEEFHLQEAGYSLTEFLKLKRQYRWIYLFHLDMK